MPTGRWLAKLPMAFCKTPHWEMWSWTVFEKTSRLLSVDRTPWRQCLQWLRKQKPDKHKPIIQANNTQKNKKRKLLSEKNNHNRHKSQNNTVWNNSEPKPPAARITYCRPPIIKLSSASGGLNSPPWPVTRPDQGVCPGPHWGCASRPRYKLAFPRSP